MMFLVQQAMQNIYEQITKKKETALLERLKEMGLETNSDHIAQSSENSEHTFWWTKNKDHPVRIITFRQIDNKLLMQDGFSNITVELEYY